MNLQEAFLALSQKLPKDEALLKRLDRAYSIVDGYGYTITHEGEGLYRVEKASTSLFTDESRVYTVTNKTCSCPDFEKVRAGMCKHRLAVRLLEMMNNDT